MYKYYKVILAALIGIYAMPALAQHNVDAYAITPADTRISGWASGCTVQRGWLDISDKNQGLASFGVDANAVGAPTGSTDVVSLGDSGVAVLTFASPIQNLDGPDFAVFENGFLDPQNPQNAFLEFAFVEVSSDGLYYVRFPAGYTGPDTPQCSNASFVDGRKYTNLAGRYIMGYGTPFDLEELKNTPGLDVNNITHLRLIDVIGSIAPELGSADANENMINDPFPSAFASGGFDLAGVAVLNNHSNSLKELKGDALCHIVPNPAMDYIRFEGLPDKNFYYRIVNVLGQEMRSGEVVSGANIDVSGLTAGSYFVYVHGNGISSAIRLMKQ